MVEQTRRRLYSPPPPARRIRGVNHLVISRNAESAKSDNHNNAPIGEAAAATSATSTATTAAATTAAVSTATTPEVAATTTPALAAASNTPYLDKNNSMRNKKWYSLPLNKQKNNMQRRFKRLIEARDMLTSDVDLLKRSLMKALTAFDIKKARNLPQSLHHLMENDEQILQQLKLYLKHMTDVAVNPKFPSSNWDHGVSVLLSIRREPADPQFEIINNDVMQFLDLPGVCHLQRKIITIILKAGMIERDEMYA